MYIRILTALCALLVFILPAARADNVLKLDGYTVYYSAFNSDLLEAKVANAYHLGHGCDHGVLTIAVHTQKNVPVAAEIKATAVTLIGQTSRIKMHKVHDGKAIYYVGGFFISNTGDPVKIDIDVLPQGAKSKGHLEIKQRFFQC